MRRRRSARARRSRPASSFKRRPAATDFTQRVRPPFLPAVRSRVIPPAALLALAALAACAPRGDAARTEAEAELRALYEADQSDRRPLPTGLSIAVRDSQIAATMARDSARRARVRELVARDLVSTADGFAHAAMIINHAHDTVSYHFAHALAMRGLDLEPSHREAGRLAAITADNLRWRRGEPTWYSIKVRGGLREPPVAHAVDSTRIPDAERVRLGFDSLAAQRRQVEAMTRSWRPPR